MQISKDVTDKTTTIKLCKIPNGLNYLFSRNDNKQNKFPTFTSKYLKWRVTNFTDIAYI